MNDNDCLIKSENYLNRFCYGVDSRRVGSIGNQTSVKMTADLISKFGFEIAFQEFKCIDWENNLAELRVDGQGFNVFSSPYSLGCNVEAELDIVSNIRELESAEIEGKILILHGEITQEQLMPKNFPFYNPEHHQQIYKLLETKNPEAIISITGRNPELAGGMYPFPMIEDGDFKIPSVYIKDIEGEELLKCQGKKASLVINARRINSKGENLVAIKGKNSEKRIVLCAHIDAKDDTPGALDNGTGVVTLILLAELLRDYTGDLGIEIVFLNGEDHYSAQGQKEYIKQRGGKFQGILFALNIDVAGYIEGTTAFSFYGCPENVEMAARSEFAKFSEMKEGDQWYQSDHSIFIQNQTPAIAFTSSEFMSLSTNVTHTQKDTPKLVDHRKIVNLAYAIRNLILCLN